MKVVIQIPCYNEEKSLPVTLADLPKSLPGIDRVEWLVIDDGSTDHTVEVAQSLGVQHFVRFPQNRGLAKGFMAGLEKAVSVGADIIVNTDADNQYHGGDIAKLIQPILDGKADIVIGERPIMQTAHFSVIKKILQKLGSWVVRKASRTSVPDAPSGFRALSRSAALQMKVFSEYTYTLETIIQAGQKGLAIRSVQIRTNKDLRPSKLVKSIPSYVKKSLFTIARIFIVYRPFRFFSLVAFFLISAGVALGLRYLYYKYVGGRGTGHLQSVVLSGVFLVTGYMTFLVGILSDVVSVNRKLLEEINTRLWTLEAKMTQDQKENARR
jgi:glycosyltransferase involved in cell wall biosynthesis